MTSLLSLGLLAHGGTAAAQSFPLLPVQPPSQAIPVTPDPFPPLPSSTPASPQKIPQPQPKDILPLPKAGTDSSGFRALRETPGLEVLTRLESEADFKERMRQDAMKSGERIIFPEEVVLSTEPYPGRHWSPMLKQVEPAFVVHGRLHFEQQNFERGLWDFGVFTPVLSAGKFFWDVALLPYHCGTRPLQQYDTSAGKCMPGDPVPFYLYPPELSLTGAAAQGAVLLGGFFVFP